MVRSSRHRKSWLLAIAVILWACVAYASTVVQLAVGTAAHLPEIDGRGQVYVRHVVYAPGEVGPWHYHPGPLYVVMKSGQLRIDEACGASVTYGVGSAFREEPLHISRALNPDSSEPAEFYVIALIPDGMPINVPVSAPVCVGPPVAVDECSSGGWMAFTVPRMFRNQGDCVSFVQSRVR
jgi:quercetin dioxygenase-like cupin family protein